MTKNILYFHQYTENLVFQKEFAEKLLAEPGFEDYTTISVITQYFCEPEILFMVESNAFFPQPQGFSACVKLKSKKRFGDVSDEKKFIRFIKDVFRYKNKTLSNALQLCVPLLQKELGIDKETLKKKISGLKFKDQKVYLLEVEEFVELFLHLSKS